MKLPLSIALVAAVAFATSVESRADDMPLAVGAAGEGFTNRLSRVEAGWTDGAEQVELSNGAETCLVDTCGARVNGGACPQTR